MKSYFIHFILLLFLACAFSSCLVEPKFPREPRIFFKDLRVIDKEQDSLILTIGFEDGNGDLGIDGNEEQPPFNRYNYINTNGKIDSVLNENFFNIFIQMYVLNGQGVFEEIQTPTGTARLDGRFPRLFEEGPEKPIEGDLTYRRFIAAGLKGLISEKVIKFSVKIKDRELNESNRIESDTLKLPKLN